MSEEEAESEGGPAAEEDAALGGEEETDDEGDEEEGHGWLVEEAEAGGDAEDDPPLPRAGAGDDADDGEEAGHPEDRFDGVHGEEAVDAEVLRCEEDAEHGQGLGGASATEGPGEEAGEEDHKGSGEVREQADAEERGAEEGFGEAGLDGDEGSVVDVSPGEASTAHDVVELVAEVAVAEVLDVERTDDVKDEFKGSEGEGQFEGSGERRVLGPDERGAGQGHASLREVLHKGCCVGCSMLYEPVPGEFRCVGFAQAWPGSELISLGGVYPLWSGPLLPLIGGEDDRRLHLRVEQLVV